MLLNDYVGKHFFFENPDANEERSKNFGFKSNLTPTRNEHLAPFENNLYDIVSNT